MRITVVTPVYNGMPWLPECIGSVAEQRREVDVEHLVYDAGSTDGSAEWLREHVSLGYEAIFEPDAGQTDALAKGFARASGDVYAWLNADDLLEPGSLRRVVEVFKGDPGLAFVTGACLVIDPQGAVVGAFRAPQEATLAGLLRVPTFPPQPATFFSARAYKSTDGLDRQYNLAMDLDLWLKLATVGPIKSLPTEVLARYRRQPNAKTEMSAAAGARQALRIRRRHGMPSRSPAAVVLIREGYIRPVTSPWTRAVRRVVKWLLLGPQRHDSSATSG
jgi:glycosyltransferase involved in cell wall biosynthesis